MSSAIIEHANITVKDSEKTAKWLSEVFGWKIRWRGPSKNNGHTVHVGGEHSYVAVYTPPVEKSLRSGNLNQYIGGLNHIGIVVDDLDAVEDKVLAAGFKTGSHGDYEPGRRFYFHDTDGIEYEVVSYA